MRRTKLAAHQLSAVAASLTGIQQHLWDTLFLHMAFEACFKVAPSGRQVAMKRMTVVNLLVALLLKLLNLLAAPCSGPQSFNEANQECTSYACSGPARRAACPSAATIDELLHHDTPKLKKLGRRFNWDHGPSGTPVDCPGGGWQEATHHYPSTYFKKNVIAAVCDPIVARLVCICAGCEHRRV